MCHARTHTSPEYCKTSTGSCRPLLCEEDGKKKTKNTERCNIGDIPAKCPNDTSPSFSTSHPHAKSQQAKFPSVPPLALVRVPIGAPVAGQNQYLTSSPANTATFQTSQPSSTCLQRSSLTLANPSRNSPQHQYHCLPSRGMTTDHHHHHYRNTTESNNALLTPLNISLPIPPGCPSLGNLHSIPQASKLSRPPSSSFSNPPWPVMIPPCYARGQVLRSPSLHRLVHGFRTSAISKAMLAGACDGKNMCDMSAPSHINVWLLLRGRKHHFPVPHPDVQDLGRSPGKVTRAKPG